MGRITKSQMRCVHVVMNEFTDDRDTRLEMLSDICQRRIDSTKDLTEEEAKMIIRELGGDKIRDAVMKKGHLRKTIYHLSMRIDFLNMRFPDDDYDTKMMNCAKVDRWLLTYGIVKKKVSEMTTSELGKTIGQMKSIINNQ